MGGTAEPAAPQPTAKKTGGGLGLQGSDYLNLGLLAAGSLQYEKEKERERKEAQRLEAKADVRYNRETMDAAKQRVEDNQRSDRAMNMQGLDMLAKQREQARVNGRRISFRNALSNALGGQ